MSQELLPIAPAGYTWSKLWSIIRTTPWHLALVLTLFVLASVGVIITPLMIGRLIDQAFAGTLTGFPWLELAIIGGATIAVALLDRAWAIQSQILGTRLNQELSIEAMEASLSLNAQTIEDAGSGDLLTRVTTDIDSVRQSVTDGIPEIAQVTVYFMVLTITLFALSPAIGLVIVPMLVGMVFLLRHYMPRIARRVITKTQRTSRLTTVVTENVRGLNTIRELGIHNERARAFDQKNEQVYTLGMKIIGLRARLWGMDAMLSYTPLILTLVWGSYAVQRGWTSWGVLSTTAILVFNMRQYSDQFSFWLDRLRESTITMGRIFGIIQLAEQQHTQRSQQESTPTLTTPNIIDMHNVSFGYSPQHPVIHNINLHLAPGDSLALVGRSGSGKTTLARLMSGSLTASNGNTYVMGQPVGNGNLPTNPAPDDRPRLLVCTQEAHQFIGTIKDNMNIVKPTASPQEIIEALTAVHATWIHDLPQGIETSIGKDQHQLTTDQLQQLALARIVLANPHAVILDESTTQLETADATASLHAVFSHRAVIIISHDARIACLAQKAILLQDGRITAEGTPQEIFDTAPKHP